MNSYLESLVGIHILGSFCHLIVFCNYFLAAVPTQPARVNVVAATIGAVVGVAIGVIIVVLIVIVVLIILNKGKHKQHTYSLPGEQQLPYLTCY